MNTRDNNGGLELVHSTPALSEEERKLLDKAPDSLIEARLEDIEVRLADMPEQETLARARLQLELAGHLLDLDRKDEAHRHARPLIDQFVEHSEFEDAALAGQYTYLADGDDAIAALGHAAWLAVTYPVDPGLTANVLNHIVDETPDDADGAAVAAATAHYVADMRRHLCDNDDVSLFTAGMLAQVAKRHSGVESEDDFNRWVDKLELNEPDRFLVRLRNVIDVLVQDDWWFDRDHLRQQIRD